MRIYFNALDTYYDVTLIDSGPQVKDEPRYGYLVYVEYPRKKVSADELTSYPNYKYYGYPVTIYIPITRKEYKDITSRKKFRIISGHVLFRDMCAQMNNQCKLTDIIYEDLHFVIL